jgi:hypothetical protein
MTGTVTQVKGLLCRIGGTTGTVYFAHRNHFVNPSEMYDGNRVEFREGLAKTGPLLWRRTSWPFTAKPPNLFRIPHLQKLPPIHPDPSQRLSS